MLAGRLDGRWWFETALVPTSFPWYPLTPERKTQEWVDDVTRRFWLKIILLIRVVGVSMYWRNWITQEMSTIPQTTLLAFAPGYVKRYSEEILLS